MYFVHIQNYIQVKSTKQLYIEMKPQTAKHGGATLQRSC